MKEDTFLKRRILIETISQSATSKLVFTWENQIKRLLSILVNVKILKVLFQV